MRSNLSAQVTRSPSTRDRVPARGLRPARVMRPSARSCEGQARRRELRFGPADTTSMDAGSARETGPPRVNMGSVGVLYGLAGVVALVLGGLLLDNPSISGDEDTFRIGGLALLGVGAYLVVAGGVARGMQLAQRLRD